MKEKYVIDYENAEIIVKMTKEQAKAIEWFMNEFDINGIIDTIENYEVREI